MSKALKIVLKIFLVIFALFTGTFIVYFFNLDMKLTAKMEPLLYWFYDKKVKRDQHL